MRREAQCRIPLNPKATLLRLFHTPSPIFSFHPPTPPKLQTPNMDATKQPRPHPTRPLRTRLYYALRLWGFKLFVTGALYALRTIKASSTRRIGPTYTKRYPVRPTLEHRIFLPSYHDDDARAPDQRTGRLPLYIDVHGGGFALADPQTDDFFCRAFCEKRGGMVVVSLDYRKAPLHPFPAAVEDVRACVKAVLEDRSLAFDRDRVAIGGFSAGGNLALAAVQDGFIRERVKAVIPVYPVVDFSGVYRGEFRALNGRMDMLRESGTWFNWGYLPLGCDTRNPLLSPVYAARDQLPRRMFFVGAEFDCLCREAETMAKRLVGLGEEQDAGDAAAAGGGGGGEDGLDGERKDWTGWEREGVRWRMYRDVQHGFTHVQLSGKEEVRRKRLTSGLWDEMARWLDEQVFVDQQMAN